MMNWMLRAGNPPAAARGRGSSNAGAKIPAAAISRRLKRGSGRDALIAIEGNANGPANLGRMSAAGVKGLWHQIKLKREASFSGSRKASSLVRDIIGARHHVAQAHPHRRR